MSRRLLRTRRPAPWWVRLVFDGLIIGILGAIVFPIAVSAVLPSIKVSGR